MVSFLARVQRQYLTSVSMTIVGGTSEIWRSIIATRGLSLPRSQLLAVTNIEPAGRCWRSRRGVTSVRQAP